MNLISRLKNAMPDQAWIERHPLLKRFGARLHQASLWKWSRREVATGAALGVFFGLLIPIAQIPLSAIAAIILRANLAVAMGSTLITNPLTFGPIYYAAYHSGSWILGVAENPEHAASLSGSTGAGSGIHSGIGFFEQAIAIGQPLLLGLLIFACVIGTTTYLVIHFAWSLGSLKRKS